jgi:hypothetical protein
MFILNLLKRVGFQTRHLNEPELCPDLLQCFRILFVCLPSLLFIIAISPTKPLSPVESVGLCLPFWVQLQFLFSTLDSQYPENYMTYAFGIIVRAALDVYFAAKAASRVSYD